MTESINWNTSKDSIRQKLCLRKFCATKTNVAAPGWMLLQRRSKNIWECYETNCKYVWSESTLEKKKKEKEIKKDFKSISPRKPRRLFTAFGEKFSSRGAKNNNCIYSNLTVSSETMCESKLRKTRWKKQPKKFRPKVSIFAKIFDHLETNKQRLTNNWTTNGTDVLNWVWGNGSISS